MGLSNLPPGCTDADIERHFGGGDPSKLEEEILEVLERHNVPESICENVLNLITVYETGSTDLNEPDPREDVEEPWY